MMFQVVFQYPVCLIENTRKSHKTRLLKFLEKYKTLYSRQYGFCLNHSPTHAVLDITTIYMIYSMRKTMFIF